MFPSLYILALIAQFTETPKPLGLDRADVARAGEQGQISWADAEDKISGSFTPYRPEAGHAIDLVVRVGNVQGTPFEGPVTLTLTPQAGGIGDSKTVAFNPTAKAWAAQLKSTEPGAYWIEIGYTTTRHKVVRAEVTVDEARLPRWPWYLIVGLVAVLALVLGVRAVIGKKT